MIDEPPCICGTVFEINGKCLAKTHKPLVYFCGFPVDGKPCGKVATPGCSFCDEHGEVFSARIRRETNRNLTPGLTEVDIVDRAAAPIGWRLYWLVWYFSISLVVLFALFLPVHSWLHSHLKLLLGILIGSWLELAICERWHVWLWDRVRWMRWFSHQ